MAFYDQAPGKKKKISYGDLGSWEEEGTRYRGSRSQKTSGKKSVGRQHGSDPSGKIVYKTSDRNKENLKEGTSFSSSRTKPENRIPDRKKPSFSSHRDILKEKYTLRTEKNLSPKETHPDENSFPDNKSIDFHDFEYRGKKEDVRVDSEEPNSILCGRNPIREALKNDRDIEKLLVQKGELSGSAREIVAIAKAKKIMIQEVEKKRLDEIAFHHQGLIAIASAYTYASVDDILASAARLGEAPFIILLDSVTDPHNLGAIIRTAECVGAHGVIVPQHRSVGLTPATVKASAGAVEHIPVARVMNLNRTIDELKSRGIWIYAVTMGAQDYESVDFREGTALVIGAEGEGISRLTLEKCDLAVSLPMKGKIDSLNASVAAGVMMYRVLSSRKKK